MSDNEIMAIECSKLRSRLLNKKIEIEDLSQYKSMIFEPLARMALSGKYLIDIGNLKDFLYLCLDYYTFTEDILIPDYDYDMLMRVYESMGGVRFTEADPISINMWPLVDHEDRSMVGSIAKIYSREEFNEYYRKYSHFTSFVVGPKYDGISAAVKLQNGRIKRAWTRYDGIKGQDITAVVSNAKNASTFMNFLPSVLVDPDGFYKVELAVSNEDFEELIKEKEYANRRSATSGIVNSPKNIALARFITIIPLARKRFDGLVEYFPRGSHIVEQVGSADCLFDHVKDVLSECMDVSFPFRYDGVVIFPLIKRYNDEDILDDAIAYKINTKFGFTKIKKLYISIGRTGKAMPMAEVYPVEVNETRVTDISLGSFGNYVNMDLRDDEQICVYSAGDVIPQIMKPEKTLEKKTGERLLLPLVCPYCGEPLKTIGKEMFCMNDKCLRFVAGRIANFCDKIGIENVSDKTIETLYLDGLIEKIPDIFKLKHDDIAQLDGFGPQSADMIISNINSVVGKPITVDKFYGALGIPDCAEKTCRKIFSVISIKDIDKTFVTGKWSKLEFEVQCIKGIGNKIAKSFIKFIKENDEEIQDLLDILTISGLPKYIGSVCFTGFRNPEYEEKFNMIGYEVSNNVTSSTKVLINGSGSNTSTKCKAAMKNDIPIIKVNKIDEVLDYLNRNKNLWTLLENEDMQ